MTTQEMIAVMQAYADGKQIEFKRLWDDDWEDVNDAHWDWVSCEYRVKPEPKEPTYRPYKDFDEFRAEWEKHGGWVDYNDGGFGRVTYFSIESATTLVKTRWADDGTPCGVKVED